MADTDKEVTIVGFGDSITLASRQPDDDKWLNVLGKRLAKDFPRVRFNMVNAGAGGNTTREGLARIERDVIAHRPNIVLVQFGGNDATRDQARHVGLDEFDANLEAIRQRITDCGCRQIVMLTFPPVIDDWHAWGKDEFFNELGGLDAYVEQYRERTRLFARQCGLPLADIDDALRVAIERDREAAYILPDGVHLTAAGNRVVADTVARAIARLLRG